MKCHELWSQQIPKPSDPNTKLTNQVKSICYNTEGTCTIAVVGDAILLYDSDTGIMLNKPIRGAHKESINCVQFSKDGKRFATCGDDKSVVIFKYTPEDETRVTAELKYQHSEEVFTLSFNPLTSQIFSGGAVDMALWTPEQGNIEKNKSKQKIISCAWSADGMTLAYGTMQGNIFFKSRKLEAKAEVNRTSPIWCMDWTPITPDSLESLLCVGAWDQTITFYNQLGQQVGSSRQLNGFDPLSIQFFSNGEFYILSGTNKKASLYSKEGGFLIDVCEQQDWIWGAKLRNKDMQAAIASNDGNIIQYKIQPLTIYSLYQDKYACRDGLTDILVQSISVNQKVRVKCKELVRNVSVYKDKLAALLNDRIMIYVTSDENKLKYRLQKRITKKNLQCTHFEVLSYNILVSNKRKIQLFKFNGDLEREWIMDAKIRYLKNTGGPTKGENIIVGLNNGNVLKVMINNSFPVILQQHQIPINVCDLSMDRKKLAIVDKNKNMTIYDLITKEVLSTEMQVTSCAFNTLFNETIAYSGQDVLYIRSGNQQPLSQRYQGKIVGLKGNKMFVQDGNTLNTIDVSQTTTMLNYIHKNEFQLAYNVACLGITQDDFKTLGLAALGKQQFEIAKKCFLRINEVEYFELVNKYEQLQQNGQLNETYLQAEILAYQQEYHKAEKLYKDAEQIEEAVKMWTELKKFDQAKNLIGSRSGFRPGTKTSAMKNQNIEDSQQIKALLNNEADHKNKMGNWKEAAQIYLDSKEYKKAMEIYNKNHHMDGLIEVCRQMDKENNIKELQSCAYQFRKNKNHSYAKEVYLKLGDTKSLIAMNVEMEKFEEALLLGKQDPSLLEIVKLPYAHWLAKNDRYPEALQAFKQLHRHDLTTQMLNQLSQNAVVENRFQDAAYYFWVLATECLKLITNAKRPSSEDEEYLQKFQDYLDYAEIYYSYSKIYQYIEEPIQPLSGIAFLLHIFNASRFAINKLQNKSLFGVKQSFIYYALGKVSKQLEGFKTARQCYEKLSFYKINPAWNEEVDLNNLLIRSKPFSDKESLLPTCNRCMNSNPVISNGLNCTSCMHKLQTSFLSFENLPLVEFKIEQGISHQKVQELIYSDKSKLPPQLRKRGTGADESSPFLDKLNETFEIQQTSQEYIPVVLNEQLLQTLSPDEVYWVDYTKFCPTMEIRYFKCMISDIALKVCQECCKFFFLDEFEFEYLKNKKCPFCQTLDQREGPEKDVFEI